MSKGPCSAMSRSRSTATNSQPLALSGPREIRKKTNNQSNDHWPKWEGQRGIQGDGSNIGPRETGELALGHVVADATRLVALHLTPSCLTDYFLFLFSLFPLFS